MNKIQSFHFAYDYYFYFQNHPFISIYEQMMFCNSFYLTVLYIPFTLFAFGIFSFGLVAY